MLLALLLLDEAERRRRLEIAADRIGGKAQLGRALGYKDGAFVGQMIRGERPITERTLRQLSELREGSDLFSFVPGPEGHVVGMAAAGNDDGVQFMRRGPARPLEPPSPFPSMQPILAWQHEDELPEGEFVMVPRLEVHLSAGHGAGSNQVEIQFDEAQPQAFRAEWVRQQHLRPRKLAAMTARGDSMEPTIHDGDSLLVDTSQTEVVDGKVYALWYEGGERVKRLYRMPGGGLRIKSDNSSFETIELTADYMGHVRVIGRVVHRSGTGGL